MKKVILITLLLAFPLVCFAQDAVTQASYNYDKELLEYGIRFIPPNGWKRTEETKNPDNTIPIFFEHPDNLANICITSPLETPTESHFNSVMSLFRDGIGLRKGQRVLSEEKITLCDVPCYVFIVEQELGEVTAKAKFHNFFKDGKTYHITYTSTYEDFDRFLPEFEKALNSFEVVE